MQAIEKILVPTDFSPAAERALAEAVALARAYGASVTLLHAYGLPPPIGEGLLYDPDLLDALERNAKAQLDRVDVADDVHVERKVTLAMPADAIHDEVLKGRYDLVVMGTHGRTGFRRLVLGSVAERVVRESPVAVMTLRPPAEELSAPPPRRA